MQIGEILTRLYAYSKRTGRAPVIKDKNVSGAIKEAYRKIGSARKALYISGALPDERKKTYPQMSYVGKGGTFVLDRASMERLGRICAGSPFLKEKIL